MRDAGTHGHSDCVQVRTQFQFFFLMLFWRGIAVGQRMHFVFFPWRKLVSRSEVKDKGHTAGAEEDVTGFYIKVKIMHFVHFLQAGQHHAEDT